MVSVFSVRMLAAILPITPSFWSMARVMATASRCCRAMRWTSVDLFLRGPDGFAFGDHVRQQPLP